MQRLWGVRHVLPERVPFQTLLDYLEGGNSLDEFLEDFPGVSRDLAVAALQQTGRRYESA